MFVWILMMVGAGCNGPGPQFPNSPAQRVVVGGDTFQLRRQGAYMQAMRVNLRGIPRVDEIARGAEHAMEQTSGCDVRWLVGDVAVMLGGLRCGDVPAPPQPKNPLSYLFCDVSEGGEAYVVACYD